MSLFEYLAPTNPIFRRAYLKLHNSVGDFDNATRKRFEKSLRELTKKYQEMYDDLPNETIKIQDKIIVLHKKLMQKNSDNIFHLAVEYSEKSNLTHLSLFEQDKAEYLLVELLKTYVAMKEQKYFNNALSSLCSTVRAVDTGIIKGDLQLVVCLHYMKYYNINDVEYKATVYNNMLPLYKKAKRLSEPVFKLPRVNAKNKKELEKEAYDLCFAYFMNNPTQLVDGVNLDLSDF